MNVRSLAILLVAVGLSLGQAPAKKEAPKEPQVATMAKLVGQSFTMKISPKGQVSDVKGFEKIMDLLMKDLEGQPQAEMMREVFARIDRALARRADAATKVVPLKAKTRNAAA